jgi:hypothetical protein
MKIYRMLVFCVSIFAYNTPVQALQHYLAPLTFPSVPTVSQGCHARAQVYVSSSEQYVQALLHYQTWLFDSQLQFLSQCLDFPKPLPRACANAIREHAHRLTLNPQSVLHQPMCESLQASGTQTIVYHSVPHALVQGPLMLLPRSATYQTLVHELAHFAYFVDEYPLPKHLQKSQCSTQWYAPNMWRLSKEQWQTGRTTQLSPVAHLAQLAQYSDDPYTDVYTSWLAQFPDLADFVDQDCQHPDYVWLGLMADRFTFLRYNDINDIPGLYRYLWQTQLQQGRFAHY